MNKRKQIDVLKEELNSLESIVINFQRNASSNHINYTNQPKIFHSSYFTPAETSRKTINSKYKSNFNQIDPRVHYEVLPNNPRHNKFTFIAKKSENVFINRNIQSSSLPQFSKCTGIKANNHDSRVSLSATKVNLSYSPSNKTINQAIKDLNALKQNNLTVPSRKFLNSQNSLKLSSETTLRTQLSNASLVKPCHPSSIKTSMHLAKTNSIKLGECFMPKTMVKHEVNKDSLYKIKQNACQINLSVKRQRDNIFTPHIRSSIIPSKDFPKTNDFIPLSTNIRDTKNQFKLVNRNINLPAKLKMLVKNSPEQNFPFKKPLMPKTKQLLLNKYCIENANKNIAKSDSKPSTIFSQNNSFPSKYKVVNQHVPKNSIIHDSKLDIVENEKTNSTNMSISNGNLLNETESEIKKQSLSQKINSLKFKCSNQELDILTDFSPDELVAMDTQSLLKLSAILKSSNKKQERLIKKSKYKLVSKRPSLLHKTAKMIKTKYKVKVKSPKSWAKHGIYMPSSSRSRHDKWKSQWLHKGLREHVQETGLKLKNSRYRRTNPMVLTNRYPASKMKLTRTSRRPLTLQNGKFSLKRTHGVNTLESATQNFASRVLHKSIQTASAAQKKKLKKSNTYCMFFNRFGKCNRGTSCPFIHDPSKIAVCSKFLRGICKTRNCPFSHEKNPGKMAICSFFLQGLCTKQDCPYRHEQLNPDAKLCKKFVQGYCSLGTKCEKVHVLICPDHFKGECSKGNSCAYPHPPKKERKNCSNQTKNIGNNKEISKVVQLEDNFLEDSESEDEACRYFNIEPRSESRSKTVIVESDNSKSISCRPQRSKIVDTPLFIPL